MVGEEDEEAGESELPGEQEGNGGRDHCSPFNLSKVTCSIYVQKSLQNTSIWSKEGRTSAELYQITQMF